MRRKVPTLLAVSLKLAIAQSVSRRDWAKQMIPNSVLMCAMACHTPPEATPNPCGADGVMWGYLRLCGEI
jgi:hypothetical protein